VSATFAATVKLGGELSNAVTIFVADEKTTPTQASPEIASAGGMVLMSIPYLIEDEGGKTKLLGLTVELDQALKPQKAYRLKKGGEALHPAFIDAADNKAYLVGALLGRLIPDLYLIEVRGDTVTYSKRFIEPGVLPTFIASGKDCYIVGGMTEAWPVTLEDEKIAIERADVKVDKTEIILPEGEGLTFSKSSINTEAIQPRLNQPTGKNAFYLTTCTKQTTKTDTQTTQETRATTETRTTPHQTQTFQELITPLAIVLAGILAGTVIYLRYGRRPPPPPPPPPPPHLLSRATHATLKYRLLVTTINGY